MTFGAMKIVPNFHIYCSFGVKFGVMTLQVVLLGMSEIRDNLL